MKPRNQIGLGIAIVATIAPIAVLGMVGVVNELRLRSSGVVVIADNPQVRVHVRDSEARDVIYNFVVAGQSYTRIDVTRTPVWSAVDGEGNRELTGRAIRVLYWPDDPWVNRPVNAAATPLGDPLAAASLFGLVLMVGLSLVVTGVRRRHKEKEARDPSAF